MSSAEETTENLLPKPREVVGRGAPVLPRVATKISWVGDADARA